MRISDWSSDVCSSDLASDFLVSEASMTGESFPVEKRPGRVAADAPITKRTNCVFLGASVRSGTAKVLVARTGRETEFGAIAARLRARPPETDRSEEHTSELQSLMRISYAVFCLKKQNTNPYDRQQQE